MTTETATKTAAASARSKTDRADPGDNTANPSDTSDTSVLVVHYCGESFEVTASPFSIGRDADLVIDDDNRFIHRRFLELTRIGDDGPLWCLTNVGCRLTATVAAANGQLEAYLAPGAQLPIVVPSHTVWFTAGPTTYEFDIEYRQATLRPTPARLDESALSGDTTAGRTPLTPDQFRLIVALAEPTLRHLDSARRGSRVPSSADAARRLNWTMTKFNRKLDNVCQRFTAQGVRGLHGQPGNLASDRRARLVEYAIAARVVDATDLAILDVGDADKGG